uniref:Cytochrome P450 n=1 Tax=Timema genevievae TaxID=629358 RepID=A0A7R9K4N9_TIMGE|nr:unnamed protein product [Timema genevievae]
MKLAWCLSRPGGSSADLAFSAANKRKAVALSTCRRGEGFPGFLGWSHRLWVSWPLVQHWVSGVGRTLSRDDAIQSVLDVVKAEFRCLDGLPRIKATANRSYKYCDINITVTEESLRKHPPVMFLRRQCTKLFELKNDAGKAWQIEPKTSIIIPTYAIHNDPKYYPDPEIFDPERFSEENIQNRPKYTYLPFGKGPRICLVLAKTALNLLDVNGKIGTRVIGMKFGQILNKCAVAFLVTHFDLNTTLKTPASLSPNPKAFVFSPLEDIWLEYIQLSSNVE